MKRCDFIDITASPTAGMKMDVRLNVTTVRGFLNTMKTYDDGCLLHWRAKICCFLNFLFRQRLLPVCFHLCVCDVTSVFTSAFTRWGLMEPQPCGRCGSGSGIKLLEMLETRKATQYSLVNHSCSDHSFRKKCLKTGQQEETLQSADWDDSFSGQCHVSGDFEWKSERVFEEKTCIWAELKHNGSETDKSFNRRWRGILGETQTRQPTKHWFWTRGRKTRHGNFSRLDVNVCSFWGSASVPDPTGVSH